MHDAGALLAGFEGDLKTLPVQLVLGILAGSIYALIALGYTMVYGILKLINFAHGEIFMLGAYIGLFISWVAIGNASARMATTIIAPDAFASGSVALIVLGVVGTFVLYRIARARKKDTGKALIGVGLAVMGALGLVLAKFQPQAITLVVMMLASMVGCAIIGVLIEYFAYRPMRSQPRIAALITAIGVSLFIQFTGQLFLPVAPPPSIPESVNPYRGSMHFYLSPPPEGLAHKYEDAQGRADELKVTFDTMVTENSWDEFSLPPEGLAARDAFQAAALEANNLKGLVEDQSVSVSIPTGQFIMFVTAIVLMIGLRHLVMKTATGRSMRAVSHDFDAASLMGVNVNRVVAVTFIIGSALAGAGAMMNATFLGTPLTSFYGLVPGVKAFVAAVLGGIGNIPGAVLGGLLMGVAEGLVVWAGYSSFKDAFAFVILIVVLLFRPGGLLGSSAVEKV
ncbi:MAG: branched-chain amino acid ABC transporter permease [Fimbriimonadaceae bacterium]